MFLSCTYMNTIPGYIYIYNVAKKNHVMIQITNTSMTRKVKSFYTIHHIILKHKNHQHKVYVCDIEIVKFTTKLSLVTNFVCSQWLTVTCANTYLVEQTHYLSLIHI